MSQLYYCPRQYIRTAEGWLYLSVVLDLYSRRVIAWGMGSRLTREPVARTITIAVTGGCPTGSTSLRE